MRFLGLSALVLGLMSGSAAPPVYGDLRLEPGAEPRLGADLADTLVARVPNFERQAFDYSTQPVELQTVARQASAPATPWSGLYFGASIVFAKPHLKESFQANLYDAVNDVMTLVPFSSGYRTTPRFWLGVGLPNDLGVQARYWEFNQGLDPYDAALISPFAVPGTSTVTVIFPTAISAAAPGDVLSVRSGLEMRSIDLEGTLRQYWQRTQVLLSGGLRYALIRQDYDARIVSAGGAQTASLTWDRKLEGVGPIIGAQLRRPLSFAGLAFVGGGRAGLIFASKDIHRTVVGKLPAPPANNVVSFDDADELLMNLETEFGLEWSRRLSFGDLSVRGTYEAQLWSDSGGSALGYLGVEGFGVSVGFSR
jgi:hypothetical protein